VSYASDASENLWEAALPTSMPGAECIPQSVRGLSRYGIADHDVPPGLEREILAFSTWETEGIQLDRAGAYTKKVQRPTMTNHVGTIRSFMGFMSVAYDIDVESVSLSLYQDAHKFLAFISFLVDRDVSRGHCLSHVSLANKINAFLQSRATNTVHVQHCERLTKWFNVLNAQLSNTIAMPVKVAPALRGMWEWVDKVAEGALLVVDGKMPDVLQVQAAIIALLVTGRETPPCRLSILKTVVHPSQVEVGSCRDPDCNLSGCLGNRVELTEDRLVRIIAPHHKTEDSRKGSMSVTLPSGTLSTLMQFWITEGWDSLSRRAPGGRRSGNLFTSSLTNAFTDSTFTQYWKKVMSSAGAAYFPPNLARTSFVESYVSVMDQGLWQGAAQVMGNTPRQWGASYTPSSRNRTMQMAVDGHAVFQGRVTGSGEGPAQNPRPAPALAMVVSPQPTSARPSSNAGILRDEMTMPFKNHPQPSAGEVEPLFVHSRSGGRAKRARDVAVTSPQWGGVWSGW
jgi:hypothetical protein